MISSMDKLPKDVLKIIQNRELSIEKKLLAYTLLVPNLPASPAHETACDTNLELGKIIKKLIVDGKLAIKAMKEDSTLELLYEE